jgi:quercetin dioxygenase-like cupin family protein
VTEHSISPLAQTATADFLDVLGPLVKPLTALTKADDDYCVFQSIFPHGVVVPLHSHADRETFYMLDGKLEALTPQGWRSLGAGEVFDVPENARHAWRNFSGSPASLLLITTLRLGRFLTKLGRPAARRPPSARRHGRNSNASPRSLSITATGSEARKIMRPWDWSSASPPRTQKVSGSNADGSIVAALRG